MRHIHGIYLASTAIITGDVMCGQNVNLWYGAVVRGDVAPITLGENVNIQDCAVVHCDYGVPNTIEAGVVIGHSAVVHGTRVGADTLIGIGAKLLSGSVVGAECIIAAGAVVPPGDDGAAAVAGDGHAGPGGASRHGPGSGEDPRQQQTLPGDGEALRRRRHCVAVREAFWTQEL